MARGGYRATAGRDSKVREIEQMMNDMNILTELSGGSGMITPRDDDPRLGMKLPVPPERLEDFYQDLGCPFTDSKTDETITKFTPYQLRTAENLRQHRKLLVLKAQKIGISSEGIVHTLLRGLRDCQGFDMIVLAQSNEKAVEHARDMKKFLANSKYKDYLITKQWQNPGPIKEEVSSTYHIYLQNRDLTSLSNTHIFVLPPSTTQIASIKRVKHVWCSDITMIDTIPERQRSYFLAILSRLVLTEGTIFIECPCVGHLGPIYELDQRFQDAVKAGIIDRETGKVLKPDVLSPKVADHMFFVDRIRVQEAVDCGMMSSEAVEALKIEHGPMFPAFFEADWYAGDSAWFGPDQLREGTVEAARLAEDLDRPPAILPYPPPRGAHGLPDPGEIQLPDSARFANTAWFLGIDPAARKDHFGVVVYGLNPKQDHPLRQKGVAHDSPPIWAPFLRDAFDIAHPNLTESVKWVENVLFQVYPPRYCIVDATRDTPVAEELQERYGDTKVEAAVMTNTLNYNMMLNAHKVFSETGPGAHEWPLRGAMRDARKKATFLEYRDQLAHERATYSPAGKIVFEKPPGRRNDLARAGVMALEAVRKFQKGRLGSPDDMSSWGSTGPPTQAIVNQVKSAELAAQDVEKMQDEEFSRWEEMRYSVGGLLSDYADPAAGGLLDDR